MTRPLAWPRLLALVAMMLLGPWPGAWTQGSQGQDASLPVPDVELGRAVQLASGGIAAPLRPATTSAESRTLQTVAQVGVRPALDRMAGTGSELAGGVRALCEQPSAASLEQARDAWREAYRAWRRAELFLFGPMEELELEKRIGYWPANRIVLDVAVAAEDVAAEDMAGILRSNDARGYAAVEHLLFAPGDAAAATADARCAHLRDLTAEIADLTARARSAWTDDYEQRFLAAGDGEPFLLPGDALSLAFAEALNVTERMLRDRIGYPSGLFDGEVKPELLEAWQSGTSREGLRATLEGLQMLVVGDGKTGVASLIATRDGVLSKKDPRLAADLERRLAKALAALDKEDRAARDALLDGPKLLRRLYRDVQRLQEQLVEATLVLELNVL